MNNTEGPRVEASRRYGASLEKRLEIPIVYHDERLTTMQAERMLVEEGNVSRKKRKHVIDMLAAVMILQNYFDLKGTELQNFYHAVQVYYQNVSRLVYGR